MKNKGFALFFILFSFALANANNISDVTGTIINDVSGVIYDSGGELAAYDNNESYDVIIATTNFAYLQIVLEIDEIALGDVLRVYDGLDATGGLLYEITSSSSEVIAFRSFSNSVYLVWTSDDTDNGNGFTMKWQGTFDVDVKFSNVSCNGDNDGSIEIAPIGGLAPYSYIWSHSMAELQNVASNLTASKYYFTVTDANSNFVIDSVEITQPSPITFSTSITNTTCSASTDGKIQVSANGGSGQYEYSINGTDWEPTSLFEGLSAGNFTVSVRDVQNNACEVTSSATIGSMPVITFSTSITNTTCSASTDGKIQVSARGGSGQYEYSIDGSSWVTESLFEGLSVNSYDVSVRDVQNNACEVTSSATIGSMPVITFSTSITNTTCSASTDGKIQVSASGGSGQYEYSINGTDWEPTSLFEGLSANSYTVSVRDVQNNACEVTSSVTIGSMPVITFFTSITNTTCSASTDGKIQVSANGGSGQYEYSINGTVWEPTSLFEGLSANSYTVSVRDVQNNACEVTSSVTIGSMPVITFFTSITNTTCSASTDGKIQVSASGGSGQYEYSINGTVWEPTSLFEGLSAGNYTVSVRDVQNNACEVTSSVTIGSMPIITFSTSITNTTCSDSEDGKIQVSANGGSGQYEYSINGTVWEPTSLFEGLSAGNYTVSVRDVQNNACEVTSSVTIGSMPVITFSTSITNTTCSASTDGKIQVSASGGSGQYEYSIDGSSWVTESLFEGLPAGDYVISVRDVQNNACEVTSSATIGSMPVITISTSITNTTCSASTDGKIQVSASGGSGQYEYSLVGEVDWQSASLFEGLPADDYVISVRDAQNNTCEVTSSATIGSMPAITFSTSITNTTCSASTDGKIQVSASGGSGQYEYSLVGEVDWQSASLFEGLPADDYVISVRDAQNNTCEVTSSATIGSMPAITISTSITNTTCSASTDGKIQVSASGGSGQYEYSLVGEVDWQSASLFEGLPADDYVISVRDAQNNTCEVTSSATIGSMPAITFSTSITNTTCSASTDGKIQVSASGGSGQYEYSLVGEVDWQSASLFEGLPADDYVISVRDAQNNTCEVTSSATIGSMPAITFSTSITNTTCSASTDGKIQVSASGGSGQYEYSLVGEVDWQSASLFEGLPADDYVISVRDAQNNTCTSSINATVGSMPAITISTSITNTTCSNSDDGKIQVSASGGSGQYEYSLVGEVDWQPASLFEGLPADDYVISVRDVQNNACEVTSSATIGSMPAITFSTSITNTTCSASTDGKIQVSANGGSGQYEYSINGTDWEPTSLFEGLSAGNYTVSVRDVQNNACEVTSSVTIGSMPIITISTSITNTTCSASTDGKIQVSASGGSGQYEYSINGTVWEPTSLFEGLSANSYTVSVRDVQNNACEVTSSVTIGSMPVITFSTSITNTTCSDSEDGKIQVSANGGSGQYEYSINGTVWEPTSLFEGLSAGNYTVSVRDVQNNACEVTSSATIGSMPVITFSTSITNTTCSASTDGKIQVSASGGSGQYEYSIDGSSWVTESLFEGLSVNSYDVSVRDVQNNACEVTSSVTIGSMPVITFSTSITNTTCSASTDGKIQVSASGGSGQYEYSIDGSSWVTESLFEGLSVNSYDVSVRDVQNNACEVTSSATIGSMPIITFSTSITNTTCSASTDGKIQVSASGGSGQYEYSINGTVWEPTSLFEGLSAGNYTVSVRDVQNNACEVTSSVTIGSMPIITISTSITNTTCSASTDGKIQVSASGGSGQYEYSINGSSWVTESLFEGLPAGDYVISVRDVQNNACESTSTVSVSSNSLFTIGFEKKDISCLNSNDGEIRLFALNGLGSFEYSNNNIDWQTSNVFTNITPGTHTFYVVNQTQTSCIQSVDVEFVATTGISINSSITNNLCFGDNSGQINVTVSGGTAPYDYIWSDGSNNRNLSNINSGIYSLTVTDSKSCEQYLTSISVTQPTPLVAEILPENVSHVTINGGSDGSALVEANGGTGSYSYVWNTIPQQTSSLAENLSANNYSVTITDENMCNTVASVTINEQSSLNPGRISVNNTTYDSICKGTVPLLFESVADAFGGLESYNYVWEYSNNLEDWFVEEENSTPEFQLSRNLFENTFFRRKIIDAAGAEGYSNIIRIFMIDTVNVSIVGLNTSYCESEVVANFEAFPKPLSLNTGVFVSDVNITDNGNGTAYISLFDLSGTYSVSYTYTDRYSCSSTIVKEFVVHDTLGLKLNIKNIYGVSESPDSIEVEPNPFIGIGTGVLYGAGINPHTMYFHPNVAGIENSHRISYQFTDLNGCTNTITKLVNVVTSGGNIRTTDGNDISIICSNSSAIEIVAIPDENPDVLGVFSCSDPNIIIDNNDGTAIIDVENISSSIDSITIFYDYYSNSVLYQVIKRVAIFNIGTVNINPLSDGYCLNSDPVELSVTNTRAGTFSINGTVISSFIPERWGVNEGEGHKIVYTTNSFYGCRESDSVFVKVYSLPEINTLTYKKIFNIEENPFDLSADVSSNGGEGVFSGQGISQSEGTFSFYPSVARAGNHNIRYRFEDINGCIANASGIVKVENNNQTIFVPDADKIYCLTQDADILTAVPDTFNVVGSFYGPGITDLQNDSAIFNPQLAGEGVHTIYYTYFVDLGIEPYDTARFTISTQIQVDALPEIDFGPIASSYCIDGEDAIFTGTPRATYPRGNFVGAGIQNNIANSNAVFSPELAGVGSFDIKYIYTNVNNCSDSIVKTITVYDLPQINSINYKSLYNVAEARDTLRATPSGGHFFGSGILSDSIFSPIGAGVGSHTVTYSYTDNNSCTSDTVFSIRVEDAVGRVDLSDSDAAYCYNQGVDTIVGIPGDFDSVRSYFQGRGIENIGNNRAVFNPQIAGSGNHTISYTYIVNGSTGLNDSAVFVVYKDVYVDSIGNVDFGTLASSYCIQNSAIRLVGTPRANYPLGNFIGEGISNNISNADFIPSEAGVGEFEIKYIYTTVNGCKDSVSKTVVVNPMPQISWLSVKPVYNVNDNTETLLSEPTPGRFIGPGISSDVVFTPSVAGLGLHNILFEYTDANGCSVDSSMQVSVREARGEIIVPEDDLVYCYTQQSDTLIGIPDVEGVIGEFSGAGITDLGDNTALFNPALAGSGVHQIMFSYWVESNVENVQATQFYVNVNILVDSVGIVDFGGLANNYCIDNQEVQLVGSPRVNFPYGEFSGNGIRNNINNAIFSPHQAGIGSHEIKYKYTTIHNCSDSVSKTVVVNPLPRITDIRARRLYNVNENREVFRGYPSGGIFYGEGILSDSIFVPSVAGLGVHVVIYELTDEFACKSDSLFAVLVEDANGVIALTDNDNKYCYNQLPDTITGTANHPSVIGVFEGPGITNIGNNKAVFTPRDAGAGTHIIYYNYTGVNGEANFTVSTEVFVDSIGELSFDIEQNLYCQNQSQFRVPVLNNRTDGTHHFSGIDADGGLSSQGRVAFISPQFIEPNDYEVVYTYTTANGCKDSISQVFTIAALPDVEIVANAVYNVESEAQIIRGIPQGGVFYGPGVVYDNSINSYLFYPSISGTGQFPIRYEYSDNNSCLNSVTTQFNVYNAMAEITGNKPYYCYYDEPDTLIASSLNGLLGGTISGPGIVEFEPQKSDTVLFYPNIAGGGHHRIAYRYYTPDSTEFSIYLTLNVDYNREVTMTGLNSREYCSDAQPEVLVAFPAGGTFYGSGVEGNRFIPSNANEGLNYVQYVHEMVFTQNFGNDTLLVCYSRAIDSVIVNSTPEVYFSGFNENKEYCANHSSVNLDFHPQGGIFSANVFVHNDSAIVNPQNLNLGSNIITYSYTDSNNCSASYSETITINRVPALRILGLSSQYCRNSDNDTISGEIIGFPDMTAGYFSGEGIVILDSIVLFVPDSVGQNGTSIITYNYVDDNGCENSVTSNVLVHDLPIVQLAGFNQSYCQSADFVNLIGTPNGGIYTVDDVSGENLNRLSLDNEGTHYLSYKYVDARGCSNFVTDSIYIHPRANVSFSILDECMVDSIVFINNTVSAEAIISWEWNFGNAINPETNTSNLMNPKYLYNVEGPKRVSLSATTSSGCRYTKDSTIVLGTGPVADFVWENECFGTSPVLFFDNTAGSSIAHYTWSFGDGDSAFVQNPEHNFTQVQDFNVTLKVATVSNCTDSVTKIISIRPVINNFPYNEDFERGKAGWAAKSISNVNSWELGVPSGQLLNSAASGQNAWVTNLTGNFNYNEQSSVDGPCFDFSNIEKPMIKIKYQSQTDLGFDGAVLQASVDNGLTWERVGQLEDGINWYNVGGIVGNPGDQTLEQLGWSGNKHDKWYEARRNLDYFAGMSNVRFRVAFGSDASSNKEGFAFDDIWIGERSKMVLIEQFTNSSSVVASQIMPLFNEFVDDNSLDVVDLQYHTNIGGEDVMYSHNPMVAGARVLYYGVTDIPHSAMDGNQYNKNTFALLNNPGLLHLRTLEDPIFGIEITPYISRDMVEVAARVKALTDLSDINLTLHIAIVENQILDVKGRNGETSFRSVVKTLLPNSAGTNIRQAWSKHDYKDYLYSWTYQNVYKPDQIAIVVFVQDEDTKEVYQVATVNNAITETVGLEHLFADNYTKSKQIHISPNPCSTDAKVVFRGINVDNGMVQVINEFGYVVENISYDGKSEIMLKSSNYTPGIYFVQLISDSETIATEKLVVVK
jgi:hypothetical protein